MSYPLTRQRSSTRTPQRARLLLVLITIASLCLLPFLVRGLTKFRAHNGSSGLPNASVARLNDSVSVRTAGRGNPSINLSNGHDLVTAYNGPDELRVALEQNLAQPLSLASADFDEDGVPDLVSGYAYNGQGIVTLLRGNVDSIYPNAPEAQQRKAEGTFTNAPFLSPANVFAAPLSADFIGAGDFDSDTHWDVLIASRTRDALFLLSGDGNGNFVLTKEISLPGVVTAMITGEINRRDGLTDIVVGVNGPEGSQAMVFEGPDGAFRSQPESLPAHAPITALALGRLDGDPTVDLAFGAGHELTIVHGRDRKLSLDEEIRATVPPARLERHPLGDRISALGVRDSTGTRNPDLVVLFEAGSLSAFSWADAAEQSRQPRGQGRMLSLGFWPGATQLVSTHLSAQPDGDLLILDPGHRQLHVVSENAPATYTNGLLATLEFESESVAMLPMRLNSDALSDLVMLSQNKSSPSVVPTSPATVFTVTNNNNSGAGSLRQAITDANANPGADTITFSIGSGVQTILLATSLPIITGAVTIDGTTQPGFAGKPLIVLDGVNTGMGGIGLEISGGSCVVRGLVIKRFGFKHDLFTPLFAYGVVTELTGSILLEGNFIGIDETGLVRAGNQQGVGVYSPNNTIGGTAAAARNVISGGYFGTGLYLNAGNNIVQGNFLGLDANGANAVENEGNGIFINNSNNNTVGGTVAGARNIISGNVYPDFAIAAAAPGSQGNLVQGNFIGTDVSGTRRIFNTNFDVSQRMGLILGGIDQAIAVGNTIGGTTAAARNLIAGHFQGGVGIFNNGTTNNLLQGNFIGLDVSGSLPIGNSVGILATDAPGNTIGGSTAGARNTIAGNTKDGVELGPFNFVTRTIGGSGVTVQGNNIGTDATGTLCMGNGRDGVFVELESLIHTVKENRIGCNARNGVNIPNVTDASGNPAVRIFIDSNSVYNNGALGIDLGPPGITQNDVGDGDVGANLLQNFPVLTAADPVTFPASPAGATGPLAPTSLNIKGTLNSTPNTAFTIHWYFTTDLQCVVNQEHNQPLAFGRIPGVVTDGNGNALFNFPFDFPPGTSGGIINTTATDPNGNTSEFSSCFKVGVDPSPSPTPTPIPTPTPSATPGPPANNNFALAQLILGSSGTVNGSNVGATKETGEWDHANNTGGKSVWYLWQPPSSGSVTVTTAGTGFDTLLAVYTGSNVGFVTRIASNDDVGGGALTSSVTFDAVAGTNYRVVVDGYGGVSGNLTLNWNLGGGPSPTPTPTPTGCSTLTFTPNQSIPDNAPAGVNIPLAVSSVSGNVSDLNVRLDGITHTFVGDLKLTLTAPNGTSSSVFVDRPGVPTSTFGCSSDDFINTVLDDEAAGGSIESICVNGMSGSFTPNNPLTIFDGLNPNGTWNMNAADLAVGDLGNVQAVSLVICTNQSLPSTVQFDASPYTAAENIGSKLVTIVRTGGAAAAATVNYATSDTAGASNCNVLGSGKASSRCDYETTAGTLKFSAGETSKTILIPIVDDVYAEGNESFTITLSDPSGASLGSPSVATVNITDNESTTGTNPLSLPPFFVRLHYIDFFTREPDSGGLAFWSDQITSCGTDQACIEIRRINVSAAFYVSIEFQETGFLVYRFYKASYGNILGAPVPVRFGEFLPDTQEIGRGVIIGQPGADQLLESNKVAFAAGFVVRARFTSAYPTSLTPAQFVDALFTNAAVVPLAADRTAAINEFGAATNTTDTAARARALRRVAENATLRQQETNKAFVLMQYFGYLRRNPYDPPEATLDYSGFNFWLGKLNQFNGNFVNAEMVKAFIISGEYKQRFGP